VLQAVDVGDPRLGNRLKIEHEHENGQEQAAADRDRMRPGGVYNCGRSGEPEWGSGAQGA